MPKDQYRFTKYSSEGSIEVNINLEDGCTWMEVMDEFVNFLRGCGYLISSDITDHLYNLQKQGVVKSHFPKENAPKSDVA